MYIHPRTHVQQLYMKTEIESKLQPNRQTYRPIERSMYRPLYDVWHVMLSYLFHTCFNMNTYINNIYSLSNNCLHKCTLH